MHRVLRPVKKSASVPRLFPRPHRKPGAYFLSVAVLSTGIAAASSPGPSDAPPGPTFTNPILHPPAQDPQLSLHAGRFYYCESSPEGIFVRIADDFIDLAAAKPIRIWMPPARGGASKNIWAPELHWLDGKCYIYFAADDGHNANHRMWVLEGVSSNPLDGFRLAGSLDTQGWAIDGTILELDGGRYFVWSGWPGNRDGQQNLYAARMKSPVELEGLRVLIASPDQPWERKGMPICEGPQILQRDGRTFLVYSASGSWTPDYGLGMLALRGGNPLSPGAWEKAGAVFLRNEFAVGVGHCGFVTSRDGGEDWIVYHAKTTLRHGWGDREVRTQRFHWSGDGWPIFGEPVAVNAALERPGVAAERIARARRAASRLASLTPENELAEAALR